jgi:hypothetical protein
MEDEFLGDEWQVFHEVLSFLSRQKLEKKLQPGNKKPRDSLHRVHSGKSRENIVAGSGFVPILPALRSRCVGSVKGKHPATCAGFFVARI